jgi:hypothetical protein
MADISLRRTLAGFDPADGPSVDAWKKLKLGQVYKSSITKPRNYKHHCMFMALMEVTFANQERYTNARMFRRAVALQAGHVEQFITLDGEVRLIPLAYSYDEIPDEDDFTVKFAEAMAVCANILHSMNLRDLEAEVSRYASERYGVAA